MCQKPFFFWCFSLYPHVSWKSKDIKDPSITPKHDEMFPFYLQDEFHNWRKYLQLPMLLTRTWAWVLFSQHLDLPHLSGGWLSYWILTNVCSKSEISNYFVYIKKENLLFAVYVNLWEKWEQTTKWYIHISVYLAQYLQFVSGALKWAQNLAGLKLVFSKLAVLWQPHWLCVLYRTFTADFTPPHTLQYEVSWRHSPCFTFTQYHPHIRQRHTWWAWQCGSIVTLCYSKPFSCVVRVGHTFSTRWCCCVVFYWCALSYMYPT